MTTEKLNDKKLPAKNTKEAASVSKTTDAVELKAMTVEGEAVQDPNDPYNKSYTVTNSSTATKTDTPIMEPVSIEVVPQEVLKDQQAFRIEDAVKNVSGVQKRAFGGSDDFIIRGFDSGRLLFRNGTRIPLLNLDFANIQQIEVLKGPASILFGRIEPGGMVNAVTKRPQEDAYYSLEQRFGSYDLYRTEANATGVPLQMINHCCIVLICPISIPIPFVTIFLMNVLGMVESFVEHNHDFSTPYRCDNTAAALKQIGVALPVIDERVFGKSLDYLSDAGVLERPGTNAPREINRV